MASPHQIGAIVHVTTGQTIYTALVTDPELYLMGTFSAQSANVDDIRVRKTIYLPTSFVGVFLERDLIPFEACIFLYGGIINAGVTVDCRPILHWIQAIITIKIGEYQSSPISIPQPTDPPGNGNLMRHRHQVITYQLPRINPTL